MTSASDILRANLAALARHDPALAATVRDTPAATLQWLPSRAGPITATLGGTLLASKYDPAAEAAKLLADVDGAKTACVVLLGLGLGYQLAPAVEAIGPEGLVLVYEPDVATFRAVLEQRDLTPWLTNPKIAWMIGPCADRAALLRRLEPWASVLTQGTQLITLPQLRARWNETFTQFGQWMAEVVAYCRTNIATLLVNTARTCRNLAANLGVYAAGATTNELKDAAKGYPAVLVGAGPSLVKNVDLLADPAVRANVVVIAVQTTLRPLLDRGIVPDFVTALDYSPICAQFYEGLPPLPGVTLVAEPKANAAILDAYPGPVRITQNTFNDHLLGDPRHGGLARPIVPIRGGATVAHLSLYLAQHLGCEPIMFIGQDLGFSDGLYYAPGTAVHQVWDCELNAFNSIEMMEWQRIVRMRSHLQRFDDVHGRPIFSDEQMLTYLKQFERDFADAVAAGQTIIDATEGGMPKTHTMRMTLREALEQYATRRVPALPLPPDGLDGTRLAQLDALLRKRLDEVRSLQKLTRESISIVRDLQRHLASGDKAKLNRTYDKLEKNRGRIEGELSEIFALVNQLNTIGAYRRSRADRAIARDAADPQERFALQLKRDEANLDWIAQACDEARGIFEEAQKRNSFTAAPIREAA